MPSLSASTVRLPLPSKPSDTMASIAPSYLTPSAFLAAWEPVIRFSEPSASSMVRPYSPGVPGSSADSPRIAGAVRQVRSTPSRISRTLSAPPARTTICTSVASPLMR